MAVTAGTPLVSMFEAADQVNQSLPATISAFVERFVALGVESRTSPQAIIHTGRLQSLDAIVGKDVESFDFAFGTLKIPLITTGVPFRLAFTRAAVTGSLEPGAGAWQFDLMLGEFELTLNGMIAAEYVAESGTTPRHLAPLPGNKPAAIVGAAALRFERTASDQPVVTRLMDAVGGGDPFLPNVGTGGVTNVTLAPPHVLIGTSQFGLTVRNVLFDYASDFSPAFVLDRGQAADWVGLAIEEAAIYCPSNAVGKGGFSLSLKDVLIGDPLGLQAEVEVQFGASPLNPATFAFTQDVDGTTTDITSGFDFDDGTLEIQTTPGGTVELTASLAVPAPPADSDVTDYRAEFDFPGRPAETGDSASGTVGHGDVVKITPIEVLGTPPDERELRKPEFTVRMVASGTAPSIATVLDTTTRTNVVDLSGPVSALDGLVLTAVPQPADPDAVFRWECATLGLDLTGETLILGSGSAVGVHLIKLSQTNTEAGTTHLRLRVRAEGEGDLLVGCEDGVFAAADPATALEPASVLGTYDLAGFHESGRLNGADATTTLSGATVDVPAGAIAEVAVFEGGAPADFEEDRHVQVLFPFDESIEAGWGDKTPFGDRGSNLHEALLTWASHYTGGKFVVIGRCDDVGSDGYNVGLATRRMERGAELLTTAAGGLAAIPAASVDGHQEQSLAALDAATEALIEPDRGENSARLIKDPDEVDRSTWPQDGSGNGERSNPPDPVREAIRTTYRRVDIYAVGGTSSDEARRDTSEAIAPTRRQILVPAAGRDVLPADNDAAKADYRVLLKLGWDRPRFSGWEDIVPNLAEFEYAWTPAPDDGISTTSEVLTVFGKWIYDDLTGFTQFTIGIESEGDPDGLFDIEQQNLVAALTFGPMLASGVDFDEDAVGSGVRLAALAAITGFAGTNFGGDGPLIGTDSKSVFTKLQAKAETRTIADPTASYKVQILTDYSNTVHIDAGALGLRTDPNQPMKIKYTDVGVEFDNTDPDAPLIEKIGLAQSSNSMSIEDSGLWKISGPLGELLRITEFKMGTSSLWFEPTLAVAIDIGVVEITEASFRVTFETDASGELLGSPTFSLRGLKASVDIPAVVEGEGRVRIEDNGLLRAGLDATLVPIQVKATVALAVGIPDIPEDFAPSLFLSLYAKIQFPGGIPLGPLPIAIHGFIGQVTINGQRKLPVTEDVVAREIGWWREEPDNKYEPKKRQYAFGVGVVVGTLPDASFSFSATGMVVVAFPDVEVIFGVEVEILSLPDTTAKDKKEGKSAAITGLVVINDEAVTVAVSATYEVPGLLKLTVPFGAHFPSSGASWVRIGSDNGPGRAGEAVTLTILPGTLDVKAWCFLMVEGGGLEDFGPDRDWDFGGFALGFGAGVDFSWEAGPLELTVSGAVYAGLGTAPLTIRAGMYLSGRLDLVVVSATVSANVTVAYLKLPDEEDAQVALEEAEFCAEVDLFFFTVKGCINLDFDTVGAFVPPAPPPPCASLSLSDRLNVITGEATTGSVVGAKIYDFVEVEGQTVNQGVPPEDNHTVWPDTVPVLNFSHYIRDDMPAGAQFQPSSAPAGETWFGSNRLRYAYQLTDVRLLRDDGTVVTDPSGEPLLSTWTHPPSRPADLSGEVEPSGAEVTSLQLLNRNPSAWAQSTADGGVGQPGDPGEIIRRICEPVPPPATACLLGQDGAIQTGTRIRLRRPAPAPGPYPSKFQGAGEAVITLAGQELTGTALVQLISSTGAVFVQGHMRGVPATPLATGLATAGYALPAAQVLGDGGLLLRQSMPWRIRLDRQIRNGQLTLLVCEPADDGTGDRCYSFHDLKVGQAGQSLDLEPFVATALQETPTGRNVVRGVDRLDLTNALDPRQGADDRAELEVQFPGATLRFKRPCHDLEIHFFRPSQGGLVLEVRHQDGTVTNHVSATPAGRPAVERLTSASGIVEVTFRFDGLKAIQIYRVCCLKPGQGKPDDDCVDFSTLNRDLVSQPQFVHDGVRFIPLDQGERFTLLDAVDTGPAPDTRGQDGVGDLLLPFNGARLQLSTPCPRLQVSVLLMASPVKVVAFDASGNVVADVTSPSAQSVGHVLTLAGAAPIVAVEIRGGSGEAILYRICCAGPSRPDGDACVDLDDLPRAIDGREQATVGPLRLRATDQGAQLKLVDQVDTTGATPRPGGDKRAELLINRRGLEIALSGSCLDAELHVMLFASEPVIAHGFDAAGNVVAKASATGQGTPEVLRLVARTPMVRIVVAGGADEAALYRFCCRSGKLGVASNRCISMRRLDGRTSGSEVTVDGVRFRDPSGQGALKGVPAEGDRPATLAFGDAGLGIDLPRTASHVVLSLIAREGVRYTITARTADGRTAAGEGGRTAGRTLRVTLKGADIARVAVEIEGGGALREICTRETGATDRRADTRAVLAAAPTGLPVVTGTVRDSGASAGWPGRIISSHPQETGGVCHVVRYDMPADPLAIDDILVRTAAPGRTVTFIGLCAIDDRAARWHETDEVIREELEDQINEGSDPLAGRPVILDPDTAYRIEIDWNYQVFQSEEETEMPPAEPTGAWETGGTQVFRFQTAAEDTAIPERQDGPNEHLFDPRDLDRYLADSAPANGSAHHFTADPVVFHFIHDHVTNLIERYGREWDIEVRRTDPPPRPGGVVGVPSLPLPGTLSTLLIPLEYLNPADANVTEAVTDAPCIDTERPAGGVTLAGQFPLERNVMYDANLWAVRTADDTDRAQVSAANFRTSRYADPVEMIEALGLEVGGSADIQPVPPKGLILDVGATVPAASDVEAASDRHFDLAMEAMGLGTLGLPSDDDGPRMFQIWQPDGVGGMPMVAILIDALEPLNRTAHVISGDEVVIADRVRLDAATLDGTDLTVVRLNNNATRALLVPALPLPSPFDPESFVLTFATSDGPLTARRHLRTRPLVLDLEGF